MILDAARDDAAAIVAIYNHYIVNTAVTFEEQAITATDMAQRIADVQGGDLPWLVAEQDGVVVGYAYATKWRVRHAYRFSVESTVYLAPSFAGRGIGRLLYTALIKRLSEQGYHLVIGGIALPNLASVALHESLGFHKAAEFKEVGFKFGRWVGVGYWQLVLSRPISAGAA
jgi:phosphinothricin acetyltransferase